MDATTKTMPIIPVKMFRQLLIQRGFTKGDAKKLSKQYEAHIRARDDDGPTQAPGVPSISMPPSSSSQAPSSWSRRPSSLGQHHPPNASRITKLVNIDSRFHTLHGMDATSTFTAHLSYALNHVVRMSLHELELPNSWRTINAREGNHVWHVGVGTLDDASDEAVDWFTFHLPAGNYDYNTLQETARDLPSLETPDVRLSHLLSINFRPRTGQIVLRAVQPPPPSPSCDDGTRETKRGLWLHWWHAPVCADDNDSRRTLPPLPPPFRRVSCSEPRSSLGWHLGFRHGRYDGATEHVSESVFDISGTRYLYLVVEDTHVNVNDFIIGHLGDSYLNDNILARITLPNDKYEIVNNSAVTGDPNGRSQTREYPSPVRIERLRFRLLDERGRPLNLHGMDMSLTLAFEMLRRE